MGAREDLLVVAEQLATFARGQAENGNQYAHAAHLAHGAKAALEAAALVDVEPAPIIAALERLAEQMEGPELAAALELHGPVAAIDQVAEAMRAWQTRVAEVEATAAGYERLRVLAYGLERDFSAGEGETAQRIAARIHIGLEEAEQAIENAKKGMEVQGG